MLVKQIQLFDLWILMFTITAVTSSEWAVWYKSQQSCVFKGSSVDFGCTYDYPAGYSIKTLVWFKPKPTGGILVYHLNPARINVSYRKRTEFANAAKNCTLRLHNVSESDVGKYFFLFETQSGWTWSEGTYLNVSVLPFRVTLISNRTDGFVQEGDNVQLNCKTKNCTPSGVQITWFKNGVPLPKINSTEFGFYPVSPSDYGNYSCGLNYSSSSTAPEFLLDVRYSPLNVSLAAHPARLIQSGRSLTLICESSANPPVETNSFFKMNGTDVFQIGWGHNYTVLTVSHGDSGQYFCLAENALGSQNSTVISIRVQDSEDPGHLLFVPAALGALLFGVIVIVTLFYLIKRRKQSSSIKVSTEKLPNTDDTPGLESAGSLPNTQTQEASEEIYGNLTRLDNSDNAEPQLSYAELQFQQSTSDRPTWTKTEDISVVYSTIRTNTISTEELE